MRLFLSIILLQDHFDIHNVDIKISVISWGIFCNFNDYPSYCDYRLSNKKFGNK